MANDLILEQKKILKAAIITALQNFSSKTDLRVEEVKIECKEFVSDLGKDYIYTDIAFKITL